MLQLAPAFLLKSPSPLLQCLLPSIRNMLIAKGGLVSLPPRRAKQGMSQVTGGWGAPHQVCETWPSPCPRPALSLQITRLGQRGSEAKFLDQNNSKS